MTDQQLVQLDDLLNTARQSVRNARTHLLGDAPSDPRVCRMELDSAQTAIENAVAILRGGERA